MSSPSHPSTLTPSQVQSYFAHISLPPCLHTYRYTPTNDPAKDVDFLTQLHTYTISAVPYENLSLHYSPTHKISIDPLSTYTKIVTTPSRGRGGYCMELSIFYNHLLRALGFNAYTSAVRIRYRKNFIPYGDYIGWSHIVNILTLSDGSKLHIDTAFGGDGATAPMPLVHDRPQRNLGMQEIRLYRDWIPTQTIRTPESKLWIYQYRNSTSQEWNSFYAFAEQEALEADFRVMNCWTSSAGSFQSVLVLVVKFLRREGGEGRQEIYGKRMLSAGTVKENLGGKTVVLQECGSEGERVEALRRWFGIELSGEEVEGIKGWGTEILG